MSRARCLNEELTHPHPGTADDCIGRDRFLGRVHFREFGLQDPEGDAAFEMLGITKRQAREWWLGWYDEKIKRFFGRK